LRLSDLEKSERQRTQSINAVTNGKMTFGDALAMFKSRLQDNPTHPRRGCLVHQILVLILFSVLPSLALGFSLRRGVEVEAAEMEENVGLESFGVAIPIGFFHQALNLVVQSLNASIA